MSNTKHGKSFSLGTLVEDYRVAVQEKNTSGFGIITRIISTTNGDDVYKYGQCGGVIIEWLTGEMEGFILDYNYDYLIREKIFSVD